MARRRHGVAGTGPIGRCGTDGPAAGLAASGRRAFGRRRPGRLDAGPGTPRCRRAGPALAAGGVGPRSWPSAAFSRGRAHRASDQGHGVAGDALAPADGRPGPRPGCAFTVTGAPTADAQPALPSPRTVRRHLGRLEHHRAVDVDGLPPLGPHPASRPRRSITRLSAPAHRGIGVGEVLAESPRPAAPSRASAQAWATTSASLWPTRPRSPANTTPPRHQHARSGSSLNGGRRSPRPTRMGIPRHATVPAARRSGGPGAGVATRRPGVRRSGPARRRDPGGRVPAEVVGRGDLAVAGVAGHHHHPAADRLDQGGVVGGLGSTRWARRSMSARKRLGRLHRDEVVPVDGLRPPGRRRPA